MEILFRTNGAVRFKENVAKWFIPERSAEESMSALRSALAAMDFSSTSSSTRGDYHYTRQNGKGKEYLTLLVSHVSTGNGLSGYAMSRIWTDQDYDGKPQAEVIDVDKMMNDVALAMELSIGDHAISTLTETSVPSFEEWTNLTAQP